MGEVAEMFPDDYLHIGGDELTLYGLERYELACRCACKALRRCSHDCSRLGTSSCWGEVPAIREYMTAHDMGSPLDLERYFVQRVKTILGRLKVHKHPIVWHVRNGARTRPYATRAGAHQTLTAPSSQLPITVQGIYSQLPDEITPDIAVEPWACWNTSPIATAATSHHGVLRSACWCVVILAVRLFHHGLPTSRRTARIHPACRCSLDAGRWSQVHGLRQQVAGLLLVRSV